MSDTVRMDSDQRIDPRTYLERFKQWQRAVAEHLGLNADEVFDLNDEQRGLGVDVTWDAIRSQPAPPVGVLSADGMSSDGERVTIHSRVMLTAHEWDAVIAHAGPKPRLMSRSQELALKGLMYEAEHGDTSAH